MVGGFVGFHRPHIAEIQVLVRFFIIEGTGVVQGEVQQVFLLSQPRFSPAKGSREPFIVLAGIPGIGLGIQGIDADIQRKRLFSAPFEVFSGIEQFGVHVRFKTRPKGFSSSFPGNFEEATGEVAVFYGSDAAHDFHRRDVFGGEGAEVGAVIHEVGTQAAVAGGILQVGIVSYRLPVHHDAGTQGRCGIVGTDGGCAAEIHYLRRRQYRIGGQAARQQFQQVFHAGRLDVGDGFLADGGRGGDAPLFCRRHYNLLQHADIGLKKVFSAVDQRCLCGFVAHGRDGDGSGGRDPETKTAQGVREGPAVALGDGRSYYRLTGGGIQHSAKKCLLSGCRKTDGQEKKQGNMNLYCSHFPKTGLQK